MSTMIMAACWPLKMSPAQKAVLISLADQANDDGVCWPGVATIARRTCLSERAVQEAITWLQKVGVVFREYRVNTSTSYTIAPGSYNQAAAPEKRKRTTGADGAPPADGAPGADGAPPGAADAPVGCSRRTLGVQEAHPGGADGAPKSSMNRKRNRNRTVNEDSGGGKTPPAPMQIVAGDGTIYDIPAELRYPGPDTRSHKAWVAYAIAYEKRYGSWPIWNSTVGGQICNFIDRVGVELAPRVAVHYVRRVNEEFVVRQMHPVKLLQSDAEKWATQQQTGASMTSARAKQADQLDANASVGADAMAIIRAQRAASQGGPNA